MKSKSYLFVLCLVSCFGCNSASKDKDKESMALDASKAALDALPKVPFPEYKNWSKFPVETSVNRRKVVSNTHGDVVVTTKVWLQSKKEDSVSVGSQITVQRPDTAVVENEADFAKFPSTFRLPSGFTEDQFILPAAKAKETGKEIVKIGDKEFDATIYEWTESSEAGPTTVKLWRSDDVPGRFLRQEMITKGIETTSLEEVTEVNLGKEPS